MAKAKPTAAQGASTQKRYQVRTGFVFVLKGEQADKVYQAGEELSIDQDIGDAAHQLEPLETKGGEGGGGE